ncbi:hypothetical protein ACLMJK_000373 [Lecanora helva]
MVNSSSEDQKIRNWQKDVVRSIADDAPPPARTYHAPPIQSDPPRARPVVVNQIVTNPPPVVVTRMKAQEPKPSEEISTKAMIGTVVGATAGAFIAYAMVKGASEDSQPAKVQERITYRAVEAPAGYNAVQPRPVTRIPIEDSRSHHDPYTTRNSAVHTIAPAPARAETIHTTSQHSKHTDDPSYKIINSREGPIVMVDNEQNDTRSRAPPPSRHTTVPPSHHTTIRQPAVAAPPPSAAPITEVRIAKDVPLPSHSQTSRYTRGTSATVRPRSPKQSPPNESREIPLPSVAPDDSISQVSTRISRDSGRSKRHHHSSHHHHGHGKSERKSEREYEDRRSSRSKVGDMVEEVVGALKGTSLRGSEARTSRR